MDVSKSTNKSFSWSRHGNVTHKNELEIIRKTIKTNCLKNTSDINNASYWKDKVVIDAGCGGGLKINAIAQCDTKLVIGIDASKPALKAAQTLSDKLKNENTLFIESFLEKTKQALNQANIKEADHIICAQVIHHTSEWRDILKQFSELLLTNGILTLVWVDPSLGVSKGKSGLNFLLKNRFTFLLGNSHETRTKIGKFLFSSIDEKLRQEWQVEEDSFYNDRYAAFYRFITFRKMRKVLQRNNLQIIESYPPHNVDEYLRQASYHKNASIEKKVKILKMFIYYFPLFKPLLTVLLRLKQFFLTGGTERNLLCRKIGK